MSEYQRTAAGQKRIVVYCPSQVVAFSALILYELCWYGAKVLERDGGLATGSVQLVSADGKPIGNPSGIDIKPHMSLEQVGTPDAVFVASFWGSVGRTLDDEAALMPWLRAVHEAGAIVAGFTNGTFYLAQAGLLDGCVATTYPPYAEEFADRFPQVELAPDRAMTGNGRVYCADAVASSCDLAILILEIVFGAAASREVERSFLIGFSRNYILNSAEFNGQKFHRDEAILASQKWMEMNYGSERFMVTAAGIAGMSPRNFRRRFKAATGEPPLAYLHRIRISVARDLLRQRHRSITEVCFAVGYNDLGSFNRTFKRLTGVSPRQFRSDMEGAQR